MPVRPSPVADPASVHPAVASANARWSSVEFMSPATTVGRPASHQRDSPATSRAQLPVPPGRGERGWMATKRSPEATPGAERGRSTTIVGKVPERSWVTVGRPNEERTKTVMPLASFVSSAEYAR